MAHSGEKLYAFHADAPDHRLPDHNGADNLLYFPADSRATAGPDRRMVRGALPSPGLEYFSSATHSKSNTMASVRHAVAGKVVLG